MITNYIDKIQKNDLAKKILLDKGFVLTNIDKKIDMGGFPFFENWLINNYGNYKLYFKNSTNISYYHFKNDFVILIGNAIDPIDNIIDEKKICENIYSESIKDCISKINQLTGIFVIFIILNNELFVFNDANGMHYCCYSIDKDQIVCASHMNLIPYFIDVKESKYVKKLIKYRFYKYMMGYYLPGDITKFDNVFRIVPNTYLHFSLSTLSVVRFYPYCSIKMIENKVQYEKVIKSSSNLLKQTMKLASLKWNRISISLTGGIDSNTTFAAANGNYDKFGAFSYISMYRESVDAEKAKEIADRFKVPFTAIKVPDNNADIKNYEVLKAVFEYNYGNIGSLKDNDIRKKITLIKENPCDVEVKSWVSETIRAYAYKYFGRRKFRKDLRPKDYSNLYKIFILRRKLLKETSNKFSEYIEKTSLKKHIFNYDETDFFVAEMMHGGKCSLDITLMKSCFEIFIPYNNRILLDTLLSVQLEDRISDKHHLDMKKYMNKELFDMNIRVVNLNETQGRKRMLNFLFTLNSFLPF